ncbi:MAG: hypothetical protein AAF580_00250 [Pseudomonadota bacterium]
MSEIAPASLRRTTLSAVLAEEGTVVADGLRERTLWSDGMFVTAEDFNRDQAYTVSRLSDLGQAIGKGVVEGLEVALVPGEPDAVTVSPGLGVGGGGESIVVHKAVRVPLGDVALQRATQTLTGLERGLRLQAESRSGLFVLCATPVEFTSNPTGSYATGTQGDRRLTDSLVNEATLFSLVPFSAGGSEATAQTRRALAARRLFSENGALRLPPATLPLAMMELDGNTVVWLDMHLVRREAGAGRSDAFGLGVVDTPTALAHLRQYDGAIDALITDSPGRAFAAADHFDVLPPMGRMPAACVAPRAPAPGQSPVLSHNFLPAEMPVELVALPEDEIRQLLDESLTLPPIDLTQPAERLAQTPVSIIIPVPREDWPDTPPEVVQQAEALAAAKPLGATPRTPMDLLNALIAEERDPALIDPVVNAAWQSLLAGRTTLWYARRRQFSRTDALAGTAFAFPAIPPVGPPSDTIDPGDVIVGPDVSEIAGGLRTGIESALSRWGVGLARLYRQVRPANTPAGLSIAIPLDEALLATIAADTPIAAAHVLHQMARTPTRQMAERMRELMQVPRLRRGMARQEGLVVGGIVRVLAPNMTVDDTAIALDPDVVRAANLGADIEGGEIFDPNANRLGARLQNFVDRMGGDGLIFEHVIRTGGGEMILGLSRDPNTIAQANAIARQLELAPTWQVADQTSIETQTRRNVLAATPFMGELIERVVEAPLERVDEFIGRHLRSLDEVLQQDRSQIFLQAETLVEDLLQEL